jgi:hypothetical protein
MPSVVFVQVVARLEVVPPLVGKVWAKNGFEGKWVFEMTKIALRLGAAGRLACISNRCFGNLYPETLFRESV